MVPDHHLNDDSRHLLETSLGIIGTISGLVLGLLVAAAFGSYQTQRSSIVTISAKLVLMDRMLAHYGRDADPARVSLRNTVIKLDEFLFPRSGAANIDPLKTGGEEAFDSIEALKPNTDEQKVLKAQVAASAIDVGQQRWMIFEQVNTPPSYPLLVVLTFWFGITFLGLGLLAKPNGSAYIALLLSCIAVAGAVFLIQAMYAPFTGIMRLSDEPLQAALRNLGK
jgi:hypothetical protein